MVAQGKTWPNEFLLHLGIIINGDAWGPRKEYRKITVFYKDVSIILSYRGLRLVAYRGKSSPQIYLSCLFHTVL